MITPQENFELLDPLDEYQLLMLLWSNNWDSLYWLLLTLGISFLNFQLYSIFLLSHPLFFVSLCAALGVFNPIIIFTLASFLILSIGFILSTLIYAIYTFWNTYHLVSNETIDAIMMWHSPTVSIIDIIKLLKDDKFLFMTTTLSNYIIPDHIKELIFKDVTYRLLVLNIFNRLQDFLPLYEHQDLFAEDFINFLIRVYPKPQTEVQSQQLFQCFDLLYPEHPPSYKLIHNLLECPEVYHHHHSALFTLKNSLEHGTYYKILFHIKLLPLVEEAMKMNRDRVSQTLNAFFNYAQQANITPEIDDLTPRPLSPIHSFTYFQKIKSNIFKYIWESFHTEPNEFWTIWQNIHSHPNIDSISPLIIHFCYHHDNVKSLYSCILAISQVGWEHEVDIYKLKEIYANDKQKCVFISLIKLLLDLNALIPQLFIRIINHPNPPHLYALLGDYLENHEVSKETLKDIYLLIQLSKKNQLHHPLELWEEVEEMINNKEAHIPNLSHPSPRKFIGSFSSRMQLSSITEDCELNP